MILSPLEKTSMYLCFKVSEEGAVEEWLPGEEATSGVVVVYSGHSRASTLTHSRDLPSDRFGGPMFTMYSNTDALSPDSLVRILRNSSQPDLHMRVSSIGKALLIFLWSRAFDPMCPVRAGILGVRNKEALPDIIPREIADLKDPYLYRIAHVVFGNPAVFTVYGVGRRDISEQVFGPYLKGFREYLLNTLVELGGIEKTREHKAFPLPLLVDFSSSPSTVLESISQEAVLFGTHSGSNGVTKSYPPQGHIYSAKRASVRLARAALNTGYVVLCGLTRELVSTSSSSEVRDARSGFPYMVEGYYSSFTSPLAVYWIANSLGIIGSTYSTRSMDIEREFIRATKHFESQSPVCNMRVYPLLVTSAEGVYTIQGMFEQDTTEEEEEYISKLLDSIPTRVALFATTYYPLKTAKYPRRSAGAKAIGSDMDTIVEENLWSLDGVTAGLRVLINSVVDVALNSLVFLSGTYRDLGCLLHHQDWYSSSWKFTGINLWIGTPSTSQILQHFRGKMREALVLDTKFGNPEPTIDSETLLPALGLLKRIGISRSRDLPWYPIVDREGVELTQELALSICTEYFRVVLPILATYPIQTKEGFPDVYLSMYLQDPLVSTGQIMARNGVIVDLLQILEVVRFASDIIPEDLKQHLIAIMDRAELVISGNRAQEEAAILAGVKVVAEPAISDGFAPMCGHIAEAKRLLS